MTAPSRGFARSSTPLLHATNSAVTRGSSNSNSHPGLTTSHFLTSSRFHHLQTLSGAFSTSRDFRTLPKTSKVVLLLPVYSSDLQPLPSSRVGRRRGRSETNNEIDSEPMRMDTSSFEPSDLWGLLENRGRLEASIRGPRSHGVQGASWPSLFRVRGPHAAFDSTFCQLFRLRPPPTLFVTPRGHLASIDLLCCFPCRSDTWSE